MRVKLEYYIILTIETYKECLKIRSIKPSVVRYPKFSVMEDQPEESHIKKHRKYVGIISPEDLKNLIEEASFDDTCDTMGSLTLDYGWMPAISFSACTESYGINAYITPVPKRGDEEVLVREIENHPQPDVLGEKVSRKLDQCLKVLKNVLYKEAIPKSFFIDVNQLCFEFQR